VEATGLTFVDKEDIPIAFLRITHMDSENEQPSNVDSSEGEDEDSIEVGRKMIIAMMRSKTTRI